MKQRVIVAALVNDGDKYLFLKQNKTDGAYPDMLVIPGGGLELGENPDDAMRRELLEETNITVKNLKPFNFDTAIRDYKGDVYQLIFLQYTAEYGDGEPKAGSDAKELVWVDKKDLENQPINEAAMKLLKDVGVVSS